MEVNEMICNVSLQVIPRVPDDQLYPVVDRVIELIEGSGVHYVVGPMGDDNGG